MTAGATTVRKIVKIDGDKCDGCGQCVPSCAEGAIRIIDGKARLAGENLCDGLGNCLGACPRGAITVEERPAAAFDESAVQRHLEQPSAASPRARAGPRPEPPHVAIGGDWGPQSRKLAFGGPCPGAAMRMLNIFPGQPGVAPGGRPVPGRGVAPNHPATAGESRLRQWPIQLHLLPVQGDLWRGADLLLAADCVAAACPDFHERFLAGKTLAIACPKLDDGQAYVEKLAAIFARNDIRSITIAHMEVPCCFGLERIVRLALDRAGRQLPVGTIQVSVRGGVLAAEEPGPANAE